jgi:hypothetical protein
MKEKLKFLGIASIVVLAAMGFYLWGLNGSQTGTGLEIIKSAEAAGGKVTDPVGTAGHGPGGYRTGPLRVLSWNRKTEEG